MAFLSTRLYVRGISMKVIVPSSKNYLLPAHEPRLHQFTFVFPLTADRNTV